MPQVVVPRVLSARSLQRIDRFTKNGCREWSKCRALFPWRIIYRVRIKKILGDVTRSVHENDPEFSCCLCILAQENFLPFEAYMWDMNKEHVPSIFMKRKVVCYALCKQVRFLIFPSEVIAVFQVCSIYRTGHITTWSMLTSTFRIGNQVSWQATYFNSAWRWQCELKSQNVEQPERNKRLPKLQVAVKNIAW